MTALIDGEPAGRRAGDSAKSVTYLPPAPPQTPGASAVNSVRDLLDELGVAYREHGQSSHVTPGWLGVVCPVPGCGQGGKFGRGIHVRSLKTTCWKCGPARLGDVLALASGRPLGEILGRVKLLIPDYADDAPANPRGRYQPPVGVGPLLPAHRRYLQARGFDPDELAGVWGVRGVGKDGPHRWRVVFPVCDRTGPVSWTARAVGPDVRPRYLSAPPGYQTRNGGVPWTDNPPRFPCWSKCSVRLK